MLVQILLLVSGLPLAWAQFTCTSTSGNQATFNQCVLNSQVSPAGGVGAKTPTGLLTCTAYLEFLTN